MSLSHSPETGHEPKSLPRRTGIAVSGTPVENRLRDLWSLIDFAVPGFLGDLSTFESRFSNNEHDASGLEPLVSPLILRRLFADVARDLPVRTDIPQATELSEDVAARYDAIRVEIASQYGKAASLVALTKLRMFCDPLDPPRAVFLYTLARFRRYSE